MSHSINSTLTIQHRSNITISKKYIKLIINNAIYFLERCDLSFNLYSLIKSIEPLMKFPPLKIKFISPSLKIKSIEPSLKIPSGYMQNLYKNSTNSIFFINCGFLSYNDFLTHVARVFQSNQICQTTGYNSDDINYPGYNNTIYKLTQQLLPIVLKSKKYKQISLLILTIILRNNMFPNDLIYQIYEYV